MANRPLQIGDVLLLALPDQKPQGHEQEGKRPVVVVGLPSRVGAVRYPLLIIAPLTTITGKWVKDNPTLYPTLKAPIGGITRDCVLMLDQLRAVDPSRISFYIGHIGEQECTPLLKGLEPMFNFKGGK